MEQVKVKISGTRPLLINNAAKSLNPLHPETKEIAKITGKRKKSDDDLEKIYALKWKSALYFNDKIGPYIPGANIDAMLIEAGKMTRQGADIKRALLCFDDKIPIEYKGPREIQSLYNNQNFVDIRPGKASGRGIMVSRPVFQEWGLTFSLAFDRTIFDESMIKAILDRAGKYVGLGTYRSKFGRFEVTHFSVLQNAA